MSHQSGCTPASFRHLPSASSVCFETGHDDIDYGVLDIQVSFQHEGRHTSVYLLHCFALAENYPKCSSVVPVWMDSFDFPPALAKMIVWHQDRQVLLRRLVKNALLGSQAGHVPLSNKDVCQCCLTWKDPAKRCRYQVNISFRPVELSRTKCDQS